MILRAHCMSGQIFSSCREKDKGLDPISHFRAIIQLCCGLRLPPPPFLDRYHLRSARYNSASNSTFFRMQNSSQLAFHPPTHQGSHQDQAQAPKRSCKWLVSRYVPVNSKTAHPTPRANRAFASFENFWSNSPVCCQFRRWNAPPVRASKRIKSFIQMYIFCNKQLATVWINNRPEQKSCGCFTANIYLWKNLI